MKFKSFKTKVDWQVSNRVRFTQDTKQSFHFEKEKHIDPAIPGI